MLLVTNYNKNKVVTESKGPESKKLLQLFLVPNFLIRNSSFILAFYLFVKKQPG